MLEKTQSFDMNGQNYQGIQQKLENILQKDLNYSINTTRLGKSLLRINYFNDKLDKDKQKENRITILQEPKRRIYIQVKGKLRDEQVAKIWMKLERDLHLTTQVKEKKVTLPTKEDVIYQIIELIKLKGYSIDYGDAQGFLENFYLKYGRLPKNEEISTIVKGYVIMINEDYISEQTEASIQTKPSSDTITTILEGPEVNNPIESFNNGVVVLENPTGRRRCPSCGDESSIHEVTDKSIVLMDYPRIYGKSKYCGRCGWDWR
ncbi:MAG: hypothetical protein KGD58_12300 [Candidatus Lokiarchaeota archaeon]|nr:hypothetical protein [Candidatus Lokiarchaeota archaeon]